jgi:hypothetical protein
MKDREWCDMDNELDVYLSRSLKKWAVENQPPPEGREQLLAVAATPPLHHQHLFFRILGLLFSFVFVPRLNYPREECVTVPVTRSCIWNYHFESAWRLAY